MSQVLAFSNHNEPVLDAKSEQHLVWLCEQIIANRFLPVPPEEAVFVGDGDYRAIGAEFLGHFVRRAGLMPDHDVLDIGCGIGRMAVPLTQYLDASNAIYEGIDPVANGIEWCKRTISPAYPNFGFQTQDVKNALYNPEGSIGGRGMRLPFQDGAFDFTAMISVATHLPPEEIETYCAEVFRVLRPGGKLFLTAFIIRDPQELSYPGCDPRLTSLERLENQPCWHLKGENPMAAVGFDDGFIDGAMSAAGFTLKSKSFGTWHGDQADHYQDFLIAEKPRRNA
ncbi:class I SAM-dependent methyltransferase [Thalassospira permensis]|uniref:Methyltransferase n=1 Tax=Thalassospira permensis NBRC 106175 TaxID=1353532 RepID=A0ABR4TSK0_9PROT|nr:class I SAM-dependent methyltransferase [Thalassospira permensis]KEO58176.1 methyltransferase [Thalassospira permensis NBRC 106175]